uniref:Uncharacterized protein n=1 Tax=mine drainage metagenome TaxID=410659 RepID=E6QU11_9ZZZZ
MFYKKYNLAMHTLLHHLINEVDRLFVTACMLLSG